MPVNEKVLTAGEMPFPNSQFITVDGVVLHYRVFQAVEGTMGNILLIHGFSGSTFSWRKNADSLAALGYLGVAVDLPGFGYSDRTQGINHSATYNAQLLWKMVDRIADGKANWIVAGHSMGAGTAMAMAAAQPTRTKSLILVDGAFANGGSNGGVGSWLLTSGLAKRWAEVLGKKFFYKPAKIQELLNSAYSATADTEAVNGYLAPMLLKNSASCILDMAGSKEIATVDVASVKIPVLAIWGKNDQWVPYDRSKEQLKAIVGLKTVMIDGAGHCPMETHADAFNKEVTGFFGGLK